MNQEEASLGYRAIIAQYRARQPKPPALRLACVYRQPSDYPDCYVAREWLVTAGALEARLEPLAVCADLEGCRSAVRCALGPAAYRLERSELDDPCIVETWL